MFFGLSYRGREMLRRWRSRRIHRRKEGVVREYLQRYHPTVFIETGTYRGEMVEAMRKSFERIYSIELDPALFRKAQERFKDDKRVFLLQGDSGEMLQLLLTDLRAPALFWLDAHYSEGETARGKLETPIREELQHIMEHSVKEHVILIDDARCFSGTNDYPTIEDISRMTCDLLPTHTVDVRNDIIRIHPKTETKS